MKTLKTALQWKNHSLIYAVIFVGFAVSYYFVRQLMTDMSAFGYVLSSPLTFNMIILLGLWGGLHHLIIKTKSPTMDIVVLFIGFVVIVIALRFLGGSNMKTIFG